MSNPYPDRPKGKYGDCRCCGGPKYDRGPGFCLDCTKSMNAVRTCSTALKLVRLLCRELCIKEIADQWGLSIKTVEYHWAAAKRSLKLKTYVSAVFYALRHGMLEPQTLAPRKEP